MAIEKYFIEQGDKATSDDLADVVLSGAVQNEVLVRDGSSQWVNQLLDLASMADRGDSTLIGRGDGGTGVPQQIVIGSGLAMSGVTLSATGGGSDLNALTDVTLTTPATDSILIKTAGDWVDGLIVTNSVTNNAITYAKLQQLTGRSIIARTIASTGNATTMTAGTNSLLGRVGGDLVFAQLDVAQVPDAELTLAKIQDAADNDRLLGSNNTGGGSPYIELALGTNLTISGGTLNAAGAGAGDSGYVMINDGATEFVCADHVNRTVVGNARGDNSVDLQTNRANVDEVCAAEDGVLCGGIENAIQSDANQSFIGGGLRNEIDPDPIGFRNAIVCGADNAIRHDGSNAFIGSGINHIIGAPLAFIGGGGGNEITPLGGGGSGHVICGGRSNTISTSQDDTTIGGGFNNLTLRELTTVPGGRRGVGRRRGELAYGGASDAQGQYVLNVATARTSNTTPTEMGYFNDEDFDTAPAPIIDAATIPFPIAGTYVMTFEGTVVCARTSAASSVFGAFKISGAMRKNDAGVVAFIGNPEISVIGRDDSGLSVDVDLAGSNAGARIMVTGLAATTMVWTAQWTGCEIEVPVIA